MKLPISDRLLACCNFVCKGDRVADIGCDTQLLKEAQGRPSSAVSSHFPALLF